MYHVPIYQVTNLLLRERRMLEIIHSDIPRGHIRHALFDFDGTISLIRAGWQDVMIPQMVEWLLGTPDHESEAELVQIVTEFVTRLTGKQTIYQMIQLAEEIARRGGRPENPLVYKRRYLDALWERIEDRVAGLKAGHLAPDDQMVPGARAMLAAIHARGVRCYLASGADEPYVLDEATALQVTPYFAGIYGAQDDYKTGACRTGEPQICHEPFDRPFDRLTRDLRTGFTNSHETRGQISGIRGIRGKKAQSASRNPHLPQLIDTPVGQPFEDPALPQIAERIARARAITAKSFGPDDLSH